MGDGKGSAPAANTVLTPTSDHGAIITTEYYSMNEINNGADLEYKCDCGSDGFFFPINKGGEADVVSGTCAGKSYPFSAKINNKHNGKPFLFKGGVSLEGKTCSLVRLQAKNNNEDGGRTTNSGIKLKISAKTDH